jgi:hypothetical protein
MDEDFEFYLYGVLSFNEIDWPNEDLDIFKFEFSFEACLFQFFHFLNLFKVYFIRAENFIFENMILNLFDLEEAKNFIYY